jgi:hypothetical protein
MLLSIHVPKTAGNSFREALSATFGNRLMTDYGDWAGFNVPEANDRRIFREAAMRTRRDELLKKYDVIHGHFIPDKYKGLFPNEQFLAFFRDPFQQSVAHYYFLLRNPQREHPEERILHDANMTLLDYLEWDALRDQQSKFLGSLSIGDLTFVGLSEEYPKSLELFKSTFGYDLGEQKFENVNEGRNGAEYAITAEVRAAIRKYRAADIELYARAKEIFASQLRYVLSVA